MNRKVLAKWLFEHKTELPAQMFYAGWENEIKASPHTERVYLALADQINQLYEPQPDLCPECEGQKWIWVNHGSNGYQQDECPTCKGTSKPDQSSRLLTNKEIVKAKELALSGKVTYSGEMAIAKAQLAKDDARIEALIEACQEARDYLRFNKGNASTIFDKLEQALKANPTSEVEG